MRFLGGQKPKLEQKQNLKIKKHAFFAFWVLNHLTLKNQSLLIFNIFEKFLFPLQNKGHEFMLL